MAPKKKSKSKKKRPPVSAATSWTNVFDVDSSAPDELPSSDSQTTARPPGYPTPLPCPFTIPADVHAVRAALSALTVEQLGVDTLHTGATPDRCGRTHDFFMALGPTAEERAGNLQVPPASPTFPRPPPAATLVCVAYVSPFPQSRHSANWIYFDVSSNKISWPSPGRRTHVLLFLLPGRYHPDMLNLQECPYSQIEIIGVGVMRKDVEVALMDKPADVACGPVCAAGVRPVITLRDTRTGCMTPSSIAHSKPQALRLCNMLITTNRCETAVWVYSSALELDTVEVVSHAAGGVEMGTSSGVLRNTRVKALWTGVQAGAALTLINCSMKGCCTDATLGEQTHAAVKLEHFTHMLLWNCEILDSGFHAIYASAPLTAFEINQTASLANSFMMMNIGVFSDALSHDHLAEQAKRPQGVWIHRGANIFHNNRLCTACCFLRLRPGHVGVCAHPGDEELHGMHVAEAEVEREILMCLAQPVHLYPESLPPEGQACAKTWQLHQPYDDSTNWVMYDRQRRLEEDLAAKRDIKTRPFILAIVDDVISGCSAVDRDIVERIRRNVYVKRGSVFSEAGNGPCSIFMETRVFSVTGRYACIDLALRADFTAKDSAHDYEFCSLNGVWYNGTKLACSQQPVLASRRRIAATREYDCYIASPGLLTALKRLLLGNLRLSLSKFMSLLMALAGMCAVAGFGNMHYAVQLVRSRYQGLLPDEFSDIDDDAPYVDNAGDETDEDSSNSCEGFDLPPELAKQLNCLSSDG